VCCFLVMCIFLTVPPKPKIQTFISCHCVWLRNNFGLLSTPKIKFPMILAPSISSVLHVFSLKTHTIADKFSKVTHETWHSTPFLWTSVTRLCTGTLSTH
jgi:hypothetical protein